MLLQFSPRHWSLRSTALPVCLLLLAMAYPTQARVISFAGMNWDVKSGSGLGPGPNSWSDSTDSVDVINGKLHLTLRKDGNGVWQSAEVSSQQSLGYGEYRWKVNTNFENLDKNVVVGLFTYDGDDKEIDVEFAKFGDEQANLGNFTRQATANDPIFTHDYNIDLNGDFSTHLFRWAPTRIDWASIHGHTDAPGQPGFVIAEKRLDGIGIPPDTATDRVHMNVWLFQGMAPIDPNLTEVEIIISDFDYTPLGGNATVPEPGSLGFMSLAALGLLRRRVSRG